MAATNKFEGTVHVDVFVVIFLHLRKQVRKTTIKRGEYEVLNPDFCTEICDFDFFVFFCKYLELFTVSKDLLATGVCILCMILFFMLLTGHERMNIRTSCTSSVFSLLATDRSAMLFVYDPVFSPIFGLLIPSA
jgi:hypothetical protein